MSIQSVIFYTGDIWEPVTTITSPKTGAKVDPTTVKITVTQPNGTALSPVTMTKEAVGEYNTTISLTEPGKWRCDIDTTGSYVGTKPESITVRPR